MKLHLELQHKKNKKKQKFVYRVVEKYIYVCKLNNLTETKSE